MASEAVTLEVFTDPMMGLTWEQQPTFRKLETHFPGIRIQPRMCVLVEDVYRFCDPNEIAMFGKREALKLYLKRLAQIYLDEESISGMPIVMEGFDLFSEERTSSRPLCLACEAAAAIEPKLGDAFLYRLRFATVAKCRPTTKLGEIRVIAERVGIDGKGLLSAMEGFQPNETLERNRVKATQAGAHGLPHSVVTVNGKSASLRGLPSFADYANAIDILSGGALRPSMSEEPLVAVFSLLEKRLMISDIEVMAACDMANLEEARTLMAQLQESHDCCSFVQVKSTKFLQYSKIAQ